MKPFLLGRKTLTGDALRSPHNHLTQPATGSVRPAPSGPTVEVIKQGDKVARLVVTCSCGERIEVECLYPPGS